MLYHVKTNTKLNLSDTWYTDFRDRHPKIIKRAVTHLTQLRKNNEDPKLITSFFDTLKALISEHKLLPSQVYNCD